MPAIPTPWKTNNYPSARRSDHVDVYKSETKGEVRVHDPYQWLEGNTEETEQWTTAQEAYTREFLDKNPERQVLEDEIRRNTDYAKFSAPSFKEDGRWYWYYNSGLQAQSVMYRSKDSTLPKLSAEDGPGGEVFFDPNLLSSDGTAALSSTAFSRSGKYFAYGISRSGSDFFTIYVRPTDAPLATVNGTNVSHDTGRLSDEIRFVKFSSITWTHDSKGFFYQRFADRESHGSAAEDKAGTETESDKNAMLYYHRIGTSQSEDVLVLKDPSNPEWMWGAEISEVDGRYLLVTISRDTSRKNQLWVADLQQEVIGPNIKWDKLIDKFEAKYEYVANDGAKFYLYSNADAPQHKLVSIDLADPSEKRSFVEVIPEDKNAHLEDVRAINKDNFAVVYKRNVKDEVYIYTTAGEKVTRLAEDFVGAATLSGRRHQSWFFVTLVGFTTPGTIARYDFGESEAKRWSIFNQTLVSGLNPDDFLAEQVWYESKDGTKVPMFIVRHKKTKFDGTAPGIQYVPNIRGGGEFGEEWHLGGARENKANCFDDFIAATEFLVKNKYVAPGKVAINGLLVAACVNRAPEGLLGAAVAEVGVLDLLKFADFTIGRAWTSDYGNPHDPHDFDFIYPISPLHNVPTDKVLPPTILLTADHDDRVVPLHSFKHAATLQHLLPSNPHPLLIRIDKKAGHGAGKSTEQRIKEQADKWGFVVQTLGLVSHVSG
ncbi:hypothetical protein NLI96_g10855 [Meripilus lineatus]|uniref:Prolyl endopeptidase n=1 Tax=Meripilus lineatus TaxID=2056292 RepID=A0AAD5USV5_9APHY|nr:hypothetical protein NLI96_g10855 [Physisporinus lineatus]